MAKRYFEFVEGASSKFWEVWVDGNEVRTRYGKIGANGQTTIKDEGSPAAATSLHDKLVREKTGKGYVEQTAALGPPPAAAAKLQSAIAQVDDEEEDEAPSDGARRFENTEDGAAKFWEIKVEDASHTVRFGKIGTPGQSKTKDFDDEAAAEDDAQKLIAEKTKKGYQEISGGGSAPAAGGSAALEAEIEKKPDDPNGYMVYADWLSGQNDPRGELIVLMAQAQLSNDPAKRNELNRAANALIKKHHAQLLGPLADFDGDDEKKLELVWNLGFIESVTMAWPMYDDEGGGHKRAAAQFAQLLELPSARFLRSLHLGPVPSEDEMSFQGIIDVLVKKRQPITLEELYLGELGDWDISGTSTGDFGAVAKIFKNLKRVTLRGGNIGLGKNVDLPNLLELTIETGGLTEADIADICAMKAPKLERLSIWFGDENYGASGGVDDIASILAAKGLPQLHHLGIMNCAFVNEVVQVLPQSKVLKQLKSLDLSMGCLNDQSIDAMVASKAFSHLQKINLDDNALTDASLAKVSSLAKEVIFGDEQDPERADDGHYRYVSVGE